MNKIIKGRGKIEFRKEKDKETMAKKYPDVQFEKMNPLTFTTTYKGNEMFDLKIKVGSTEIPCSFKKFAWPWKYGSILALEPHFEDLKKKAIIRISGGIQGKLFQFFRYDYEKMLKDKKGGAICWPCLLAIPSKRKKGGGKETFKSEQRKENKEYSQSVKKCRKMKAKTEKERKKKGKCYLPIDKKRLKMFQYFKKDYPEEWAEFLAPGGKGNDTQKTGLEGSWLYDWDPWPNRRSSPRKKLKGGVKKTFKSEQKKENKEYYQSIKKCRKMKDKKTKKRCYLKCNDKRSKKLKVFGKKYPEEWKEFINKSSGMSGSHAKTRLEGSWMGGHRRHCVKVTGSCDYHLKCKDDKSKKWEYMRTAEKYKPDHCKKTKKKKSKSKSRTGAKDSADAVAEVAAVVEKELKQDKNKNSLVIFIKLAKKYRITQSGSKKQIAERLSSLRGSYLSKTEKKLILPYLSNNVNKRILLKHKTRKNLPKNKK